MAGPASHGRSADRQQANSSSGDANNCAGNLGRRGSLVQHECQAGPPGAQPVSPFGEKDRLEDTWATTPGKTPERHSTRESGAPSLAEGRAVITHNIFSCGLVTKAWECPIWRVVPQDGPQGGATTSLPCMTAKEAPRLASALLPKAYLGKYQEGSGRVSPAQGISLTPARAATLVALRRSLLVLQCSLFLLRRSRLGREGRRGQK